MDGGISLLSLFRQRAGFLTSALVSKLDLEPCGTRAGESTKKAEMNETDAIVDHTDEREIVSILDQYELVLSEFHMTSPRVRRQSATTIL